jgi:hypothetical protein
METDFYVGHQLLDDGAAPGSWNKKVHFLIILFYFDLKMFMRIHLEGKGIVIVIAL